jgi:hypothetical protein
MAANLFVEVHCTQPQWVFQERNQQYSTPIYRIYVNDDLLTERTWIWTPDNTFIKEDMWVQLGKQVTYSLKLVPVLKNPAQAKFMLMNFGSTNTGYTQTRINNNEISFKLQ